MKKLIIVFFLMVNACDQTSIEKNINKKETSKKTLEEFAIEDRWYNQSQWLSGKKFYKINCLECHRKNAKGTLEWKKTLENGNYPPPPLNGSAHAWHHDIETLISTIQDGGVPLGGVMPAFKNKLSDQEILDVIAYFQNFWSDDIYNSWLEIGGLDR